MARRERREVNEKRIPRRQRKGVNGKILKMSGGDAFVHSTSVY